MSVSNYTPGNGCSYSYSKLRDRIYLVSEDHVKKIYIDNGEAYISGLTETPLVIEGFNIDFKEESSLDERYKFQKTLTISKKGYASFKDFQGKYYAIIETIDGTFYMINVDFPSKITHVFNLSKDTNQTDFTFTSLSNYPTLRINYDFGSVPYVCKGFNVSGIKGLKLCERIRTEMSSVNSTIYTYGDTTGVNERSFRTIEYLGESCAFQEAYDGVNVTDTITFDIGFDAYKTSWQYNLLEFVENLYSAIIESKGEEDIRYYSGFNHGLEPSYSIAANNGDKQSDIITITLVEASNSGLFRVDEMTVTNDNSKSWRYIRKYGNHKTYECLEPGVALYLVKEEVWANGIPTGRYMVMSGYENGFYYLNIVGTFNDEVTFYQPDCKCGSNPMYQWEILTIDSDYDCDSAATKYYKEAKVVSYDCGDTWEETGQYRRGSVYQTNSPDCGYEERWVNIPISEDYWCDICNNSIYRTTSGTTYCKYYKQEKLVSYDYGQTWQNTGEYRKGELYESDSPDCDIEYDWRLTELWECHSGIDHTPIYRWTVDTNIANAICSGTTKYYSEIKESSFDSGATWNVVYPIERQISNTVAEQASRDCGYSPSTPYEEQYFTIRATSNGELWFSPDGENGGLAYSTDNGTTWDVFEGGRVQFTTGQKILFKGVNTCDMDFKVFLDEDYYSRNQGSFAFEGNIMSLVYADDFKNQTVMKGGVRFGSYYLSYGDINYVTLNAENLILPATTLSPRCYRGMFGCFTGLTKAPVLPAPILTEQCYDSMFFHCDSLHAITCLATDISASGCTADWTRDVAENGTFTKAATMNDWPTGYAGIPSGWTVTNYS